MMNLFLALLLDNFSSDDEEADKKRLARIMSMKKVAPTPVEDAAHHSDVTQTEKMATTPQRRVSNAVVCDGGSVSPIEAPPKLDAATTTLKSSRMLPVKQLADTNHSDSVGFLHNLQGSSLFIFPGDCRIRRWALNLIVHPLFDSIVLALVAASSIALAVDNPLLDPESTLASGLKRLDLAFAIIFTFEMAVKVVALGLILHRGAYLRNGWNVLDCVIVISSLVMLTAASSSHHSLKSLRSLRTFRAFRPLRVISRRPGLKLVVNALIEATPAVLNILIVCALFYLIFSIFAVTYLKGKLYSCSGDVFNALSDDQVDFLTDPQPWSSLSLDQQQWFTNTSCVGFPTDSLTSKYVCGCLGADWGSAVPENFNNVGNAMISFFEISTTENWALLMVACIDATDVDMQPIRDNNMWWAAFFVVFMMFGSFFVVNLFVGVIIDNFNKMTDTLGGTFMLTSEQKKWMKAQKAAAHVGPQRILIPFKHPVRRKIFFFVRHPRFEWFIMICIITNTLLMASQYYGQSTIQSKAVSICNDIFAAIFTLEAALKIVAFGSAYLEDNWNRFDLFVVLGTLTTPLPGQDGAMPVQCGEVIRTF
ncbi:hypothetical protein DVH05_025491 [Phytophthora capsici]|nr:hypothetical protein DVH05_025491 [Phytophthora capsici]